MTAPTPLQPLGYQLVEIMGHQKVAGWVEPRLFGGVVLFHVSMPEQEPIEEVVELGAYVNGLDCGPGSRLRWHHRAIDQHLGAGSIFRMTAISEEEAIRCQPGQAEILERVITAQLGPGPRDDAEVAEDEDLEFEEDRVR